MDTTTTLPAPAALRPAAPAARREASSAAPAAPAAPVVPVAPTAATPAGRLDLYAGIHKALRLCMARTLALVGSTDAGDAAEVAATLAQVERLLALCELHLHDENTFVHPVLERAHPGLSMRIAGEHAHHVEAIADLRELAACVAAGRDAARRVAMERLYRALALFVADNFQHMHVEETVHNPALWAACSDAELAEVERAIVASIPPALMAEALQWFIPALSAPERAGMLAGMQSGMPPEAFDGVLAIARRTLPADAHARLLRALGLPVAPGLMTA